MPKKGGEKTKPGAFRGALKLWDLIERGAAADRKTKSSYVRTAVEEKVGLRPRQGPGPWHHEVLLYHVLLYGRCVYELLLEQKKDETKLEERLEEIRHEVQAEVRFLLYGAEPSGD
jgi:hypothetical protein